MSSCCPICNKNIEIEVTELLPDISEEISFKCPNCGAELKATAEIEVYVEKADFAQM